ncbi:MAG: acyl-CoA synthetase FdrA [Candidatus Riflebacteria bacterium]|nr:acyl-CoA synthetase FdrA [Candidatus Riflebacteria bacterium]
MPVKFEIKKQTYFDSVTLMQINTEVKKLPGIENAIIGMGTDFNLQSARRVNLWNPEFEALTPSDLLICIESGSIESALKGIEEAKALLSRKSSRSSGNSEIRPSSQTAAARMLTDANMVIISVPGAFAAREADIALDSDRHVMLFSDNVTVEEELRLKQKALSKGLLLMGPDCGTAIINNIPLAFANVVGKGDIGLVAASGTGLQEVTCVIDHLGSGISQAIGVGGRDLSEKIGGLMTIGAVEALASDPSTRVITLISKPPAETVLPKLFSELKKVTKPIVIYFIGADPQIISKAGFTPAATLEDAAIKACEISSGKRLESLMSDTAINDLAGKTKPDGKFIRGLYSGGTLCDEAQRLLLPITGEMNSNTPIKGVKKCQDLFKSTGHSIIDLGDDDFTRGKAHPMIDPDTRKERIITESMDPDAGLIFMDLVMGWGSHPDMATELSNAIRTARKKSKRNPIFAVTICGTPKDPQNYKKQWQIMEECGAIVFPTNVSMVKFIKKVISREGKNV